MEEVAVAVVEVEEEARKNKELSDATDRKNN